MDHMHVMHIGDCFQDVRHDRDYLILAKLPFLDFAFLD